MGNQPYTAIEQAIIEAGDNDFVEDLDLRARSSIIQKILSGNCISCLKKRNESYRSVRILRL